MRSYKIALLAVSMLVGSAAFATTSTTAKTSHTTATHHHTKSGQTTHSQKDAEVIATLVVLDNNEIAVASKALKNSKNTSVKQYAKMLKNAHSHNLNETLQISKKIGVKPVKSESVVILKQEGRKNLSDLSSLKGEQFDRAYIDLMIVGHKNALKVIDQRLMKAATDPSVRELLTATRPAIAAHLKEAKHIKASLK